MHTYNLYKILILHKLHSDCIYLLTDVILKKKSIEDNCKAVRGYIYQNLFIPILEINKLI